MSNFLNRILTPRVFGAFVAGLCLIIGLKAVMVFNHIKIWQVDGSSMLPTIESGDTVIAKKTLSYQKGDIVTILSPDLDGSYWVKRIVGTPGDIISVYGNYIEINGIADDVSLNYQKNDKLTGSFVLLSGEYFIAGDNRPVSNDSRISGPIKEETIVDEMLFAF